MSHFLLEAERGQNRFWSAALTRSYGRGRTYLTWGSEIKTVFDDSTLGNSDEGLELLARRWAEMQFDEG